MSLSHDIKQIFKEGLQIFWRKKNITLSSAAITTVVLLLLNLTLLFNALLGFSLAQLEERVDVNIYFFPEVGQEKIVSFQDRIATIPIVEEVNYTSREEALEDFVEEHKNDYLILQSLEELGINPLGASLNIKTFEPVQYASLIKFIEEDEIYSSAVEKVNYYQNSKIIERLGSFITTVNIIGASVTLFFIVVSMIMIFVGIKFIIESSRRDIKIKRLIGIDKRYIRGSLFVVGITEGIVATILALIVTYPVTAFFGSKTATFFGGLNAFDYYIQNFFPILFLLLALSIILTSISVVFALHKHLKD